MKKKVPVLVWVLIVLLIFCLLAWWAYQMLGKAESGSTDSYKITTVVAEGEGSIKPAKDKAKAKESVDVTIEAEDDYVVNTVSAAAKNGDEVEISTKDSSGKTFTLVMPDPGQDVTITAHFTPAEGSTAGQLPGTTEAPTVHYVDVDNDKWYADAVSYVTVKGYMSGTGKGAFNPEGQVSRAELAQMLYAMEGHPEVEIVSNFADVPADQWYAQAISWATSNAIVSGYDATTFGPNDPVTRQQMAAILYQYAVQKNYKINDADAKVLDEFNDANLIAPYATKAMSWAVQEGLLSGASQWLEPMGAASRAQTAAILKAFEENVAK